MNKTAVSGTAAAAPAPPADGLPMPRRALALAAIVVGLMLAVLDGTIANVALPSIARDLNAPASASIWIVNGYQLAIVVALLPLASLGEIIGYRRVYLGGIALFTLASVGCVLSRDLTALTVSRIIQGFGAAGLMSVNAAVLRYTVPARRFGAAIGGVSLVVAVAATFGPVLAGLILGFLSWPWLFAINIPLGLATLALGFPSLPDSDRAAHRFDGLSAVLSAVALGGAITTIDSFGHRLAWAVVVPQIAVFVTALVWLVRRERRSPRPMLPLDLLRIPVFSLSVSTSVAAFTAQLLAFVSLPFLYQVQMGFSPEKVGLLMMPWPLAIALVAPLSGWLSDRVSPAILGGVGLLCLGAGLGGLAVLPGHAQPVQIIWRMALCGVGFGLFQAPNNKVMIGTAPKARSGAASGVQSTARLTGQSLGAALVALMMARFGLAGAGYALYMAAAFALVAMGLSLARLWAPRPPGGEGGGEDGSEGGGRSEPAGRERAQPAGAGGTPRMSAAYFNK